MKDAEAMRRWKRKQKEERRSRREDVWVVDPAGSAILGRAPDTGRDLVVAGPRQDHPQEPPVSEHPFIVTSGGVVATAAEDLIVLEESARAFRSQSHAAATRAAYQTDWVHFEAWTRRVGLAAIPATPKTVATYLVAHADTHAISTLTRRISSIVTALRLAGYALDTRHPDLRETWRGIRRARGTAQRRVEALTVPLLRRVLAICGDRLIDLRDRALLVVGVGGAFRRSELCNLEAGDVAISAEGLTIRLNRSKSDQEGEGTTVAVGRTGSETCPVAAYEAWIAAAGIAGGRAFRSVDRHGRVGGSLSTRAVAQIVQARAAAAGLDPAAYSGHSMRAGFATSAAAAGIEERTLMQQTRHKSVAVARRYIRDGERWARNLSAEIGL